MEAGRPYRLTWRCRYCGCEASVEMNKHENARRLLEENGWTVGTKPVLCGRPIDSSAMQSCPDCSKLTFEGMMKHE